MVEHNVTKTRTDKVTLMQSLHGKHSTLAVGFREFCTTISAIFVEILVVMPIKSRILVIMEHHVYITTFFY